eukprot:jgi/Chlat1/5457/Chrsp36S05447
MAAVVAVRGCVVEQLSNMELCMRLPLALPLRRRQGGQHNGLRAPRHPRQQTACAAANETAVATCRPDVQTVLLSRRAALLSVSLTAVLASTPSAYATKSTNVRLKDVENPQMQAGLRAASEGDLYTAERIFTQIIEESPDAASAWSNRGNTRLQQGRPKEAFEDFTRAIKLAPDAAVPLLNRAIALEALGRFDEAVQDCNAAVKNDPDEFAAWYNRGNVHVKLQDYNEALKDFTKAADLAPGIAAYRFKEAIVLFELGRASEAVRLMQGLVRKYPNYAECRGALAAALWSLGRQGPAESQFLAAADLEGRFQDIRWVRSSLRWTPKLEQALEKFLSIT